MLSGNTASSSTIANSPRHMSWPLRHDKAELGQMTSQGIYDLRALAHQQVAGSKHDSACLLRF
jgi:hypothetical protein